MVSLPPVLPCTLHGASKSSPELTKPLLSDITHVANVHLSVSKVVWLLQNFTLSSQALEPESVEPTVFMRLSIEIKLHNCKSEIIC